MPRILAEYRNIEENQAVKILKMLVTYINNCEERGIIHHNFFPKDIIIYDEKVLIATQTSTYGYISPELLLKFTIDKHIYVIGCIMYELVASSFEGFDHSLGDDKIKEYIISTIGSHVSRDYIDIILAAIKTIPSERIEITELLTRINALDKKLNDLESTKFLTISHVPMSTLIH